MSSRPPHRLTLVSRSASETRSLGRAVSVHLEPGDLLCLVGDLGAGKTTFVQGLCQGLGAPERATSPSFTLVHEYQGRLLLYHLDLYRLAGDLTEIGLDDILGGEAAVAVEWAGKLPEKLWGESLEISFDFDDSHRSLRRLTMRAKGRRGRRLLKQIGGTIGDNPSH